MTRNGEAVLDGLEDELATRSEELISLSHALHADPELGSQEFRASSRIAGLLGDNGFTLAPVPGDLPTAFVARAGTSPLVAAICVEYDALPEIGHGCGHNVNAASAVGAALVLRPWLDQLGLSLLVLGTPAEETSGGKVDLIELGYFKGVSFAMMAHAAARDFVGAPSLAMTTWEVTFTGHPAHAAAEPENGLNALSALLITQSAIALNRQTLPKESIVSTTILEGGTAVNVIPSRARTQIEMRAPTFANLQVIKATIRRCIEAGAHATDCEFEITPCGHDFADLREDPDLCEIYRTAMARRGRQVALGTGLAASTDMGNVSHEVPAIHPWVGLDANDAALHSAEFTAAAITDSADKAILDATFGLAATAAAVALDPKQRARFSAA